MSKLFLTERGRVMMDHNEEITRWRWAKKILDLPEEALNSAADLWLLVQSYEENSEPLEVYFNGKELTKLMPGSLTPNVFWWQRISVPVEALVPGKNEIELRAANKAMNGWMLAIENGSSIDPNSFLSIDWGKSWQNDAMGAWNSLRGEYVIRLRSHNSQLQDPSAPEIIYENSQHPRVKEALQIVPESIRQIQDPWEQLLSLRSWVAQSWTYQSFGRVYIPWDPWTILDWTANDRGHGFDGAIAMCVHYATLFVSLATALGHFARCVTIEAALDKPLGHFVAEVWDKKSKKWVLHDPNFDTHFQDKDHRLSATDIAHRNHQGESVSNFVISGPGKPTSPKFLVKGFETTYSTGVCYRYVGLWGTNQYVSDPSKAPPSHGKLAFCETDIIWYSPPGMDLAPMFPYRVGDSQYFRKPPPNAGAG